MDINERIKEVRVSLGMTQEKFGEKIGVARNTIANYEMGNRNPMEQTLKSICREYGVSEEWLRDGKGNMFELRSEDEEIASYVATLLDGKSSFDKKMILLLKKMTPEQKRAFEAFFMDICKAFSDN